jgi:hypothetical protein
MTLRYDQPLIPLGADKMSDHVPKEFQMTASLEELETTEQRRVLDTVAQVRKCGWTESFRYRISLSAANSPPTRAQPSRRL